MGVVRATDDAQTRAHAAGGGVAGAHEMVDCDTFSRRRFVPESEVPCTRRASPW